MSRNVIALLILTAITAAGCGGAGGPDPAAPAAGEAQANLAPRTVRVVSPTARQVTEEVEAIGSLLPFVEAEVAADVEGVLGDLFAEVGQRVAAGAPLADIDRTTYELLLSQAESGLGQAEAQAELAEKELERKRQLLSDRTISQAVFDTYVAQEKLARAGVGAARAARDLAAHNFAKSRTKSPMAGVVAARLVDRGDRVGVGDVLFKVAETARLKLTFSLPEAYAGRVEQLREVTFTAGGADQVHTATRWAIAPVVDADSRTVACTFAVENRAGSVPAGASARVQAAFPGQQTRWVLPRTALTLEELPRVFVVVDGVARPRVVNVGRVTESEVELLGGVDQTAAVIADAAGIFDGVPVQPAGD